MKIHPIAIGQSRLILKEKMSNSRRGIRTTDPRMGGKGKGAFPHLLLKFPFQQLLVHFVRAFYSFQTRNWAQQLFQEVQGRYGPFARHFDTILLSSGNNFRLVF